MKVIVAFVVFFLMFTVVSLNKISLAINKPPLSGSNISVMVRKQMNEQDRAGSLPLYIESLRRYMTEEALKKSGCIQLTFHPRKEPSTILPIP